MGKRNNRGRETLNYEINKKKNTKERREEWLAEKKREEEKKGSENGETRVEPGIKSSIPFTDTEKSIQVFYLIHFIKTLVLGLLAFFTMIETNSLKHFQNKQVIDS